MPSASPCPRPSVSPEMWGWDHLCLGSLSQVRSLHMHLPASFYTYVCTCICPIPGQHLQALGLHGTPGLPGQCTASGHQKPWLGTSLLSAALAPRMSLKQVVRALVLGEVEHMFQSLESSPDPALPSQECLSTANFRPPSLLWRKLCWHGKTRHPPIPHHSPVGPEGQGPSACLTRLW